MKLKFKTQAYQTNAVESVVDCFAGQVNTAGIQYRLDPGRAVKGQTIGSTAASEYGFKNAKLQLNDTQLIENIHSVQRLQNLPLSNSLVASASCKVNLDIEMETGTGKTYCYIKSIFEMNKRYGWSKFIIVVPSIAIREGVYKSLDITAEHFTECYGKKIRSFVYNSRQLHHLESFSSDAGINVMVINIQAFNATGKDNRRIYDELDDFQSRRPIDVISSNRPLDITAEHFTECYGKKIRSFVYNSRQLHHLESFSSDAGINVMVINIQAFNATGKDNRRIYDELDDFQSRRPIDVISSNRPIVILDEPQKMEGKKTLEALAKFKPLMILRYSATHKTQHNKIHRLNALDAYNQKLVKKIAVRGISVKGLAGTNAYLYLESIEISKKAPVARIEIEVQQKSGAIKRKILRLDKGKDLFVQSGELEQYRGFVISQIDANHDTVEFTNGEVLNAGDATGDVTEATIRRIQIRETIKTHLEKEQQLFQQGIKVLSLFFIDEVVKYRDYSQPDDNGEYAILFEEEYKQLKAEYLGELALDNEAYRKYLARDKPSRVHEGYFSIDKKSKKLVDPKFKKRGEAAGLSDDVDAYDLILKKKERLLSFEEPVRFIFSHSALREGWDNPNVFVMCMLKHSDNTISRRQEVGRGLRLCVNQQGDRMDHPAAVHDINVLTVVASESYKDFVANLQKEISQSLSERPRKADEAYFTGKVIKTETGSVEITPLMARQIYKYLLKNDYTDDVTDQIAEAYHTAKANGGLAALPPELAAHSEQIFGLIDSVFSESQLIAPEDGRAVKANPLNGNFDKKEFKALWQRINRKAVYRVAFDSCELIRNSIRALNNELRVTPLRYTIQSGTQGEQMTDSQLKSGEGFKLENTATETHNASIHSMVKYDLLGKLADNTKLTRKTIAEMLSGIQVSVFKQFKQNPEHFISEATRLINEQKATVIIEQLTYDETSDQHSIDIFTTGQSKQDFSKASQKLKNHVYDYVVTDSNIERKFVEELDTSAEVVVYAKLPRGFFIPTPVGDYNPDWAISFKEDSVKHIYFVAETKGSMSSMDLRAIEGKKIDCARKFFDKINRKIGEDKVKYDVVTDYGKLMEMVER